MGDRCVLGLMSSDPRVPRSSYSLHTLRKVDCLSRGHPYACAFKGSAMRRIIMNFLKPTSDLIWYENMKRAYYVPYFLNLLDLLVLSVHPHIYKMYVCFPRLQIKFCFVVVVVVVVVVCVCVFVFCCVFSWGLLLFVCNLLTYVVSFIMIRTCLTSLFEKTVNEYGRRRKCASTTHNQTTRSL